MEEIITICQNGRDNYKQYGGMEEIITNKMVERKR